MKQPIPIVANISQLDAALKQVSQIAAARPDSTKAFLEFIGDDHDILITATVEERGDSLCVRVMPSPLLRYFLHLMEPAEGEPGKQEGFPPLTFTPKAKKPAEDP